MDELNVSFQIDTDNQEHFPSISAFNKFRKQRDSFYKILKVWEEKHTIPGWRFETALGGIVRSMLTLHNDAINYYHLARLFKSQLLISCIQNGDQAEAMDDDSLSLLKTLKDVNPQKLTQLHKRLITPLPSKSQAEGPTFPGPQEFFKDFILHAFNPMFYTHLENCLVHEILELNDTQFAGNEIKDSETTVEEQTQQNFILCLSSLRLLAKVLGLLAALPYRSEKTCSKEILVTQVEIRSRALPCVNLHLCLQNAIKLGKLSLTVPWIAKYLAMLDVGSVRLPYYKQIFEILFYVNKALHRQDFTTPAGRISPKTLILLKSTLVWLLGLPNSPKEFYDFWEKTFKARELWCIENLDEYYAQENVLLKDSSTSIASTKCNLDRLDIIGDNALRKYCPLFGRNVSVPGVNDTTNNLNSNKHITPVSSPLHKVSADVSAKHLELKLEEAFFHGQPVSLRKTVDFVAERVASACIKYICNSLLTECRELCVTRLRDVLKVKGNTVKFDNPENIANNLAILKRAVQNQMSSLAKESSRAVCEQCEAAIPPMCQARVVKSLEALLPQDCHPTVNKMCTEITVRLATERIDQWIQSHLVGESFFMKDMELELNRYLRSNSPIAMNFVDIKSHNPEAFSPTKTIDSLRTLIWEILEDGGRVMREETLMATFNNLQETLAQRSDLLAGPKTVIYVLTIDLALFLISYRSDLFTDEIQDEFFHLWTDVGLCSDADSPLKRALCPRNIILLSQTQNPNTWSIFGKFIKRLLTKEMLNMRVLSDECVALFRQDWPASTLKNVSKCLTEVIKDFKASDQDSEKLKYLLDWIAQTYQAIDYDGEYDTMN